MLSSRKRHKESERHSGSDASPARKSSRSRSPERRHDTQSRMDASPSQARRGCDQDSFESSRTDLQKRIFQGQEYAIVVLNHPEKLAFMGKTSLRCLSGSVDMFGWTLTADNKTYPVFSPETNSHVVLETQRGGPVNLTQLEEVIASLDVESQESEKISQSVRSCSKPVVLLFSKLTSFNMLTKIHGYRELFCSCPSRSSYEPDAVLFKDNKVGLYSSTHHIKSLTIPKSFNRVCDWISESTQKGESPVVLVCGGANTGKSTLIRYLLNTTLKQVSSVYFLDCDLGQTEFTLPGCTSLSEVKTPLLGPPFTHKQKTICSASVGMLSPADDPGYYMTCLRYVHKRYLPRHKSPLIVNTMGWTKGVGLALLADTLRLVKPDLVVQIESQSKHKNLPPITSQFILETEGWLDDCLDHSTDEVKPHTLMSIESAVSTNMDGPNRYRPADHRSLAVLAYLSSSSTDVEEVDWTAMTPYEVPWEGMAVHSVNSAVPKSHMMYALNVSLVSLCKVPKEAIISSGEKGNPSFVKGNPVCEYVGSGIVRGIDPLKKVFYILTPLSAEQCLTVNCLVRSPQDVPQQLLMNQESAANIPYVGFPKDLKGASAISRRRHQNRGHKTPTKD